MVSGIGALDLLAQRDHGIPALLHVRFLYFSFSAGRVNSCRWECGAATAPTNGIILSPDL